MNVSCLVLTFNEAANIGPCLKALSWCDDILVLDSGSTDGTVEIARSHGARILERSFDDFARQRNFGLDRGEFRYEWVLHLDADEIVTPEFVAALNALRPEPGVAAWHVPSKIMLYGRWLKHAGMYPAYQVRLGHRDQLRFIQVGHGQREDLPPSQVGEFPEPYLHYSFSHGMRHWLEKHVRYAADEAALILKDREAGATADAGAGEASAARRRAKAKAANIPLALRPPARFLYIYLYCQGFRDGRAGFVYALMLSVYEGMTAVLAYEKLLGRP